MMCRHLPYLYNDFSSNYYYMNNLYIMHYGILSDPFPCPHYIIVGRFLLLRKVFIFIATIELYTERVQYIFFIFERRMWQTFIPSVHLFIRQRIQALLEFDIHIHIILLAYSSTQRFMIWTYDMCFCALHFIIMIRWKIGSKSKTGILLFTSKSMKRYIIICITRKGC